MYGKVWTLLIAMTDNPSENIWDEFTKMSKIGHAMENLIAEFFQFSTKIIKSFALSSYLRIHL